MKHTTQKMATIFVGEIENAERSVKSAQSRIGIVGKNCSEHL
jgi:hypothetical protein